MEKATIVTGKRRENDGKSHLEGIDGNIDSQRRQKSNRN